MSTSQTTQFRTRPKTCTECRRRKVRCIRNPANAPKCRQCEDRASECVAQTYAARSGQSRRSSRYRISQLESQVATLTRLVYGTESDQSSHSVRPPEPDVTPSPASPTVNAFDGDVSVLDTVEEVDRLSHLRSLFQNELLSVESHRHNGQDVIRRGSSSMPLMETARRTLQALILPREEIWEISRMGPGWLTIQGEILPQTFGLKSESELFESYDDMCKPDVDPIDLASWLLTVAITAQQPRVCDSTSVSQREMRQRRLKHYQRVCDAVDKAILSHDNLVGTTRGLELSTHFIRLLIGQGNFREAWIRLRHVIAIAELMGLPEEVNGSQLEKSTTSDSEVQLNRVRQWELICFADRMLSMVMDLPVYTKRQKLVHDSPLLVDGVVQLAVYLRRLTDIAGKIQQLDHLNAVPGQIMELYSLALNLVRELRTLASHAPDSWWAWNTGYVEPRHVVQSMHYYIAMRVHLPFALKREERDESFFYHRLACKDACENITQRYLFLRRALPTGFVLSGMLDLQAFTATAVLLLTIHSSSFCNSSNMALEKARIKTTVGEVINTMHTRSDGAPNVSLTRDFISTLYALNTFFHDEGSGHQAQNITVKVPILGKIYVRRNNRPYLQVSEAQMTGYRQTAQDDRGWTPNLQLVPGSIDAHFSLANACGGLGDRRPDEFSCSIEMHDNSFYVDSSSRVFM